MELFVMAIVTLFFAVILSDWLTRALPFNIPLPIVQIAMGTGISYLTGLDIHIESHLFFFLFLPPLLFLDGWRIPKDDFKKDLPITIGLALGLVLVSVFAIGYMVHYLFPSIPLAVAFALGAILSPTDPIAVGAIAKKAPLPPRLLHILEGESLMNDATGLVCMKFALAAALTGVFSLEEASQSFVWMAAIGGAVGVGIIVLANSIYSLIVPSLGEEPGAKILMGLLLPFIAYWVAEHLHASGVLAVVGAGVAMAYMEQRTRTLPTTRLRRTAVWDTIQFALNGAMFVLIGEQMPQMMASATKALDTTPNNALLTILFAIVIVTFALMAMRAIWVWLSYTFFLGFLPNKTRLVLATTFAGVRGTITLAGVMAFPYMAGSAPFPGRDIAVTIAGGVVILSLLMAGIVLPPLLKNLDMPAINPDDDSEKMARLKAAQNAILAIETTHDAHNHKPHDSDQGVEWIDATARVTESYKERLDHFESDVEEYNNRMRRMQMEKDLTIAALAAERDTFLTLATERKISDSLARKLVMEIDQAELRVKASSKY